jgi:hypothetical protein
MLPFMKRLAVSSQSWCLSPCRFGVFTTNGQWPLVSRGSVSLLSALVKGEGTRRRLRGFEGWGRHLCSGPAAAAKATLALTHPSNLRETKMLTSP